MAKNEAPLGKLQQFLPPNTFEEVLYYLQRYRVELTVTKERRSILGDYRHPIQGRSHRISINGNLNSYAFLITLLHELAHLLQFEQHGNSVGAHGKEWKIIFSQLLERFISVPIFPADIQSALQRSLQNPAASSCADDVLLRVLKKYDRRNPKMILVEEVPDQSLFKTADGRVFRKGDQLRKRFRCTEVTTKKLYLFSPVYEVELV